jgi:hypothetical protein
MRLGEQAEVKARTASPKEVHSSEEFRQTWEDKVKSQKSGD